MPPPCPTTRPREEEGVTPLRSEPEGPFGPERCTREEEGTVVRVCDAPQGGGEGPPHSVRDPRIPYLVGGGTWEEDRHHRL